MENREGKRLQQEPPRGRGAKIAVISVVAALVVLGGAYVGLCAAAGAGTLPNTTVLGTDVSHMSQSQAENAVQTALRSKLSGRSVTLREGSSGQTASVPCDIVQADGLGEALAPLMTSPHFLGRGFQFLTHLASKQEAAPALSLTSEGERALDEAVAALSQDLAQPMVETTYQVSGDKLVLTKGTTGSAIDADAVKKDVLDAITEHVYESGDLSVPVALTTSPPPEPDYEAINQEVSVAPADAYLDKDTKEIVPSVTGVSFDVPNAQSILAGTGEGESAAVPLIYTEPALTTAGLNAVLFRDVLGTSTTTCSGNSNRISNIRTAANKINGMILMPGEVFSYNTEVGPYTTASGYLPAGTYQGGKSVDALAGGICQLSSTLYWTTLKANLEITERHNHQLSVDYLPKGCDATVFGGGPDFKFSNNTTQPMKILASLSGKSLTVKLIGTNTTGTRAEIESVVVSSNPMQVTYKADASVPAGSAPKRDPAYPGHNGSTVKAYRVVYNSSGKEISRTLESTSKYARQDKVMLYNPADAAALGIDPSTGKKDQVPVTPTPSVSPSTAPSASPVVTPSPAPSVEPSTQPSVAPSADPTPSAPVPPSTPVTEPQPTAVPTQDPNVPAPPPEAGGGTEISTAPPDAPVPPGG